MKWIIKTTLIALIILSNFCFQLIGKELQVALIDTSSESINYKDKFFGRYTQLAKRLNCVFSKLPNKVIVNTYPVSRINLMLKSGKLDAALPYAKTDKRDEFAVFLEPIVNVRYLLILNSKSINKEPNEVKIGVIRGSADADYTKNIGYQVIEVASHEQAMKMLTLERFDGTVIPEPALLDNGFEIDPQFKQSVLLTRPISIYVSKSAKASAKTVESLEEAIKSCI